MAGLAALETVGTQNEHPLGLLVDVQCQCKVLSAHMRSPLQMFKNGVHEAILMTIARMLGSRKTVTIIPLNGGIKFTHYELKELFVSVRSYK